MFERIRDPHHWGEKNDLEDLKNILLDVIKNDRFPYDLKQEFEKVFTDILRMISEFGSSDNKFRFCQLFVDDTFDYVILREYLNNKAFENRIYL